MRHLPNVDHAYVSRDALDCRARYTRRMRTPDDVTSAMTPGQRNVLRAVPIGLRDRVGADAVADLAGVSIRTAQRHLRALVDDDEVRTADRWTPAGFRPGYFRGYTAEQAAAVLRRITDDEQHDRELAEHDHHVGGYTRSDGTYVPTRQEAENDER